MNLSAVISSSIRKFWSFILLWPFNLKQEKFSISYFKFILSALVTTLSIMFHILLVYIRFDTYPDGTVIRFIIILSLFIWVFPILTIQLHLFISRKKIIWLLNSVQFYTVQHSELLSIKKCIRFLTVIAFVYFGPFLISFISFLRLSGLLGETSTKLQNLISVFHCYITLFLTCHSILYLAISLTLKAEIDAKNLLIEKLNYFSFNLDHLVHLFYLSDKAYETSMDFLHFFFKSSMAKLFYLVLDFLTIIFYVPDDGDFKINWEIVTFQYLVHILSNIPVYLMFFVSQGVINPITEVRNAIIYILFCAIYLHFLTICVSNNSNHKNCVIPFKELGFTYDVNRPVSRYLKRLKKSQIERNITAEKCNCSSVDIRLIYISSRKFTNTNGRN